MQTESLTLKSTPAAKLFMRFIAAFNTGDPTRISEFVTENFDADGDLNSTLDWYLNLYQASGGINIHKVYMSQEHYIIVIVKSKATGEMFMDKITITSNHPYKITEHLHEPA